MISQLKTFTVRMIAGANVVTIGFMLLVGYSDRLNPVEHPMMSNIGLTFPFFIAANMLFLLFWIIFKWRWALIPLAGYLLCFAPTRTYFPININRQPPEDAIKFISYNVFNFANSDTTLYPKDGEGEATNPIVDYLVKQNADIVCLQEAGTTKEKVANYRDSLLNGIYHYSDTIHYSKYGEVLAIYSKFPIVSKEKIEFNDQTMCCSAVFHVKMGTDTVIVVNNHLNGTGLTEDERHDFGNMVATRTLEDSTEVKTRSMIAHLNAGSVKRAAQAERLAKFVSQNKGRSLLLCGDFNDNPISYVRRTIAQQLNDCFVESGNGPGISYHKNHLLVRIDNLMCTDNFVPYHCHIDRGIAYSDHYPLVCWLKKKH